MPKKPVDALMTTISSMENRLSGTLKPVAPPREFVRGLGQRILEGNQGTLVHRVVNWHILAALITGLVSLAVLMAMLARALLGLSSKKHTA